jgi:predicted negative regulator of RcsB-dependent stress response
MDKQQLHIQLEELHAALRQVDSPDAAEQETLRRLRGDIEALLARRDDATAHHYKGLAERLREDVEQLEASHPQATLLMGRVIDALANIGI